MKKTILALLLTVSLCFGMMAPAFGISSEAQPANSFVDGSDAESVTVKTVPVEQIESFYHYDANDCTLEAEVREWISSHYPELVGDKEINFSRLYASAKQCDAESIQSTAVNSDSFLRNSSAKHVSGSRSAALVSNETELAAALLNPSMDIIIVMASFSLTYTHPINRSLYFTTLGTTYTITAASGEEHFSIQNQSAPITLSFDAVELSGNSVGGGILIQNSGVTLNDAVIKYCKYNGSCSGSAVTANNLAFDPVTNQIQASGSLTISGGLFSNNETNGGSAISCTGPISITNATISNNTGSGVSALNLSETGLSAIFNSVTICGNTSTSNNGGGLSLYGYSVTITGTANSPSTISGNAAQHSGGGVFAYMCDTDISYTTIENNTITFVEVNGRSTNPTAVGGAGIMNVGSLSLENSDVLDNTGDCDFGFGVGIYALNPATVLNNYDPDDYPWLSEEFKVTDSTISGNECTWATGADPYDRSMNGGGIAVIELKPELTRTEISDNEALIGGGALLFYAYDEDDLGPQDDPVIHFSGITVEDNVGKLAGGGIAMIGPDREDDDDVVRTSIKCKLQLEKNIENNSENPVETLTTISGNTSRYGAGITVFSVEMTVTGETRIQNNYADSAFTPFVGNDWPNWACAGGGVLLAEQSKLDLSNGEILSNTTLKTSAQQSAGAGIYAMGASEVLVHGASAVSTNGFHVEDVDDLTNRTSTSVDTMFGGGIYTEAATTTSVSGGSVHGNASSYGAGIYCCGDLDVSGGEISENVSGQSGGGIYTQSTGSLVISGGDICSNIATDGAGAGIYTTAPMTFTGGIIQRNKANSTTGGLGGGVYATNTVSMTGQYENGTCVGGIISYNEALYGGGVFYDGDEEAWTMNSGSINHNTSADDGGGVYATGFDAVWEMDDGDISYNKSTTGNGGGVYVEFDATWEMKGGSISYNESMKGDGGGIYTKCNMLLTGGTIARNRALFSDAVHNTYRHGGGIYIAAYASVVNTGCTITRNQSAGVGGGVYVEHGASYTGDSYVTLNTPDNVYRA